MAFLGLTERRVTCLFHDSVSVFVTALLSCTVIFYILAFSAVVLFYVFYTQPDDCTEHKVFISLNFLFCIVVSVVAILPKVQVKQTDVWCFVCPYSCVGVL